MEEYNSLFNIRRFKESDASLFFENIEKEKVYEYMREEFPRTRSEVERFVNASARKEMNSFVIEFKGNIVGTVSLFCEEENLQSIEIGCMWVFRQFRKLGIASQIAFQFAKLAFIEYGASTVYIQIYDKNQTSKHIASKIGFIHKPDCDSLLKDNKLCFYEMTREKFEAIYNHPEELVY